MPAPSYVDIHTHLLPGIDDGPRELDETLDMARAAHAAGIRVLVATPHLRADFPLVRVTELADRCAAVRNALAERQIGLRVVSGAEVSLLWAIEAPDRELTLATYGGLGTDLLVESPAAHVVGLKSMLSELQTRGVRVILAHPERCPDFQDDPAMLADLVEQGLVLQVNAYSVMGSERASRTCWLGRELVRQGLADVLASDGHRGEAWRPVTRLPEAVEAAAGIVGSRRAQWMATVAPAAIVAGAKLPPPPPLTPNGLGREPKARPAQKRGSRVARKA